MFQEGPSVLLQGVANGDICSFFLTEKNAILLYFERPFKEEAISFYFIGTLIPKIFAIYSESETDV